MADDLHQDSPTPDSPLPAIHRERISEVVASPENRTAIANALRRVLREKQGHLASFGSATEPTEAAPGS